MENAKKSIGITFATQYLELAIQFGGVLILARLLTPADTGIFSVAAFFMVLLHMFRDFGVVNYIIQEADLTTEKIQSAFGVAIFLALLVALIMLLSANALARFYDHPELTNILHVMALSFAVSPFGSLLFGIYRREMLFKKLLFIKISSAVCHVIVATTLAYRGFGAISLAWANFAGILSFGVAANLYRPRGIPILPRFTNIGTILSFGSVSSIGNAANAIGTNSPDLIIAKIIDMQSVGYFSRGNGLVQLFAKLIASALTPFILPYFSEIKRSGNDLKQPYLLAINYLTLLAWPFFAVMALLAQPLVRVLYGPQWDASVIVVELLCAAGAIASMSIFSGHVMIANGQLRYATISQLLAQPVRVVAVLFAAGYGLAAIALAIILGELLSFIIISRCLARTIGVRSAELIYTCRDSAIITALTMVGPLLVNLFWPSAPSAAAQSSWLALGVGAFTALFGWLLGTLLTRHPAWAHIEELFSTRKILNFSPYPVTATAAFAGSPSAIQRTKSLCKFLLYQSGFLGLLHRWRNKNALTVAMFHRVMPEPEPGADPEWSMRCDTFRHCLHFFKLHYHVISLDQLAQAVSTAQKLPPCSLLITFDDGWADTAQFAVPILEELQLSATVFVAGSVIDRAAPFWQEAVYSLLSIDLANPAVAGTDLTNRIGAARGPQKLNQALSECGITHRCIESEITDEASIRAVIRQLESSQPDQLQGLAELLHARSGAAAAMLTMEQLRNLARSQQVGSHGYTHQPLTKVTNPGAEVTHAQRVLTDALNGRPIHAMSFPHGSYDARVVQACRSVDYRYLFSSDAILNSTRQPKLQQLVFGRIAITEREITDAVRRFHPFMLAFWLFSRPISSIRYPGSGDDQ